MKARALGLVSLVLLLGIAILAQAELLRGDFASVENAEASNQQIVVAYSYLPLSFEANHGQTDQQVNFLSRGRGYSLFLTSTEAVLSLNPLQSGPRAESDIPTSYSASLASSAVSSPKQRSAVLRMQLVGANSSPQVAGKEELPGKSNYFIGNDPKQWRTNVPHYAKVHYQDVYPGIDLFFYGTDQRQLEYDFLVASGADPGAIRLAFEGAEKVEVDAAGNLVLNLPDGEVRFHKPYIYQESGRGRHEIAGNFVLRDDEQIGFEVAAYDTNQPLIIDPVLSYSTYLGGNNADSGSDIAVDTAGNAYVTGRTSSIDFPTTAGTFQFACNLDAFGCSGEAFVTKLSPDGSALVYSTYLGGTGFDMGFGIAVDDSGNAYVTGFTSSTDFPTANPLQPNCGGGFFDCDDAFVAKLDATGSALVYSTYLGGSGNESAEMNGNIAVDDSGNAYITGPTSSTDFPTTVGAFQTTFGGATDAFVTKLNADGSSLDYSTYLGGSGSESGGGISGNSSLGIAVDTGGCALVTGSTNSTDFPTVSPIQASFGGGFSDAFVTKLNVLGSTLVYSTYLGGSGSFGDIGTGVAVDTLGNAYITGPTDSTDFPTTPGAFQATGGCDAFVTKLPSDGSVLVYSTYLGGSGCEGGRDIAVDDSGNAYVTGFTSSTDFPTLNPIQVANGGFSDAFVAKLSVDGSALLFSTYLGGSGFSEEVAVGIAVDAQRSTYVVGFTPSSDFPTTVGAFQTTFGGGGGFLLDAFVAKIVNRPPVADAGPDQTLAGTNDAGTAVTLDGSASSDPDGDPLTFTWTGPFPEGSGTVTGINPTVTLDLGTSTTTLVVNDGDLDSVPDMVDITITDFTVAASPDNVTVSRGQSATYTVTISPQFGAFDNSVSLDCSGLPSLSSCSFSPSSPTPGASDGTSTLTVSTTAPSAFLVPPLGLRDDAPLYALWLGMPGVLLFGLTLGGHAPSKKLCFWLLVGVLISLLALQVACGGGGSTSPTPAPRPGTPTGTFNITITGTSGSLVRSTIATLVVQ